MIAHNATAHVQTPDFRHIRTYARTIELREALGHFVRSGWTPAELAEYAGSVSCALGQAKATALSSRIVLQRGADHEDPKEALATMRARK